MEPEGKSSNNEKPNLELAFGKSTSPNELWVSILEKVWAKLYGCYGQIEYGSPEESLHDLTRAPVKKFSLTNKKKNNGKENAL